jgi:hypothetical protein
MDPRLLSLVEVMVTDQPSRKADLIRLIDLGKEAVDAQKRRIASAEDRLRKRLARVKATKSPSKKPSWRSRKRPKFMQRRQALAIKIERKLWALSEEQGLYACAAMVIDISPSAEGQ